MNLEDLKIALQKSWSKETAFDSNGWNASNPAIGQCDVTSLIVNDYLGGEIVWAEAVQPDGKKISHYFNLINGKEIDLTRSQFPEGTIIPPGIEKKKSFPSTRELMLSDDYCKKRYDMLRKKVDEFFNNDTQSHATPQI